MIVKAIETFKFAKNCRENILFQKGVETFIDDLGLSAEQIEYMLKNCKVTKVNGFTMEPKKEIKLEKAVIATENDAEAKKVSAENMIWGSEKKVELPEYLKIQNKDDLIKYAEDQFSLKIDRRSGLETVQQIIQNHLEEEANY